MRSFNKVPPNGLVIYCGTCINEEGKEKKMSYAFEPFRPINTSLYLCDNKFHTEALQELLQDDSTFGFVVVDGSGTLFGTVSGSSRTVLHRFLVDLPKKHGRGGQSALRFARLRLEKRHNYVRKVCEHCVQFLHLGRARERGGHRAGGLGRAEGGGVRIGWACAGGVTGRHAGSAYQERGGEDRGRVVRR